MNPIDAALLQASSALDSVGARWAVIGGIAVGLRTLGRFTMDVDFAVAVADDGAAESIVYDLRSYGYSMIVPPFEQTYVDRLSTVRLGHRNSDVVVDLLFASSGIENEVADAAEWLEVVPGKRAPVATRGHLIALKTLADRDQDLSDIGRLIPLATSEDIAEAREAVQLIQRRGFHRDQDVPAKLERYIAELWEG